MPRHFGIPRPPEQDVEVNAIAGVLTFAIVLIIMVICKWGGL